MVVLGQVRITEAETLRKWRGAGKRLACIRAGFQSCVAPRAWRVMRAGARNVSIVEPVLQTHVALHSS